MTSLQEPLTYNSFLNSENQIPKSHDHAKQCAKIVTDDSHRNTYQCYQISSVFQRTWKEGKDSKGQETIALGFLSTHVAS